jgi:hypothetical protein
MTMGRALLVSLVLLTVAVPDPLLAHPGGSHGYAVLAVDGDSVRYSLTLWPATLPPAVAEEIRRTRAGDTASGRRLLDTVRDRVTLTAHGQRCQPGPGSVPPSAAAAESLTLVVDYACGGNGRELRIRDDLVDVFGADYHTLARIEAPGRTSQFVFSAETPETRVGPEPSPGAGDGFPSFVLLGIEHILIGWDHLLFLLVLLLGGGGWLALAKIITAFTIAHSVTLALAALDVVALPSRLVEAVIALSIAYVAAENLLPRRTAAPRWVVSFAFGLVHGFGFSSVLRELGLPTHGLLLSLLGFNLGVEAGQGLVVAAVLPVLAILRTTRWERRVVWSSSSAILLVGVALFVERAFL